MTNLEKELTMLLADMVRQNLYEEDGVFETGFIRLHKEVLIKLVELEVMVDAYPEKNCAESPYRDYFAKFSPNWELTLRDK